MPIAKYLIYLLSPSNTLWDIVVTESSKEFRKLFAPGLVLPNVPILTRNSVINVNEVNKNANFLKFVSGGLLMRNKTLVENQIMNANTLIGATIILQKYSRFAMMKSLKLYFCNNLKRYTVEKRISVIDR